jgi:hypothetical protein
MGLPEKHNKWEKSGKFMKFGMSGAKNHIT